MRIKLDEDLSKSVRNHLQLLGYSTETVVSQGWGGTKDIDLWPRVVAEDIFWITGDNGFGDLRQFQPGTHPGILVLRPSRQSVDAYIRLIDNVVGKYPLASLRGALTVATPSSIRIRRA